MKRRRITKAQLRREDELARERDRIRVEIMIAESVRRAEEIRQMAAIEDPVVRRICATMLADSLLQPEAFGLESWGGPRRRPTK